MTLLTIEAHPNTSCGYHRITLPFSRLKVEPKVPVFVFNRLPECGPRALEGLKHSGIKIVMDLDDYWNLPASHYLSKHYADNLTSLLLRMSIERADVVMVTNAELAGHVARVNHNVVIVPNALPFDEDQFKPRVQELRSTFIYAAGASHADDIIAHADALNIRDVTIAGVQPEHDEWKRALSAVPKARWATVQPVDSYMRQFQHHRVALAPLLPSGFNACKSNLKMLEAGAMRMPIIVSDVRPYNIGKDRDFVFLADGSASWQEAMRQCRKDPEWVRDCGLALGGYVREHYQLSAANEIRRQIIESFA